MCGISGLVNFADSRFIIQRMNLALKHRGPDAEGIWNDDYLTLGHRRLSIIDLSELANQPFVKGNLAIVYNGEIYNYPELRKNLIKEGVLFRTNSDTEVILELFRQYGEKSFSMLLGMFAFCIYDFKKQEGYLVRDYFGIKPLYYVDFSGGKFAFASELKAFLEVPGFKREISPKALASALNYLWVYGDDSIFKQAKKLPPAHFLFFKIINGGITKSIKRYWELQAGQTSLPEKDIQEKLQDIIERSVRRHLIADVGVGAFLSGGLDSSLLTVLAKKFNPEVSAYTVSFSNKARHTEQMPQDEHFAKKVANDFKIRHFQIRVEPDITRQLPETVFHLDEPIGDPAAINTFLMCNAARQEGVKVMLSGMGADEIFGGYRRQIACLLARRLRYVPGFFKHAARGLLKNVPVRAGSAGLRQVRWLKRFLPLTELPFDAAYMRSYSYYDKGELKQLLRHDFDPEVEQMHEEHSQLFNRINAFDNINKMCYTDINMFMPGLNLTYTDRASMQASTEVRVPFIDRELIEFAMSIEGKFKIRGNTSKYILKKTARHYLSRDIAFRKKASFGLPIRAWIWDDLKGYVDELLSPQSVRKRNMLDPAGVARLIADERSGKQDNAYQIYQLLTLELWCRRFIDQ